MVVVDAGEQGNSRVKARDNDKAASGGRGELFNWAKPSDLKQGKGARNVNLFLDKTGIYKLQKFTRESLPDKPSNRQKVGALDFRQAQCTVCDQIVIANGGEGMTNYRKHADKDDEHRAAVKSTPVG